MWLVLAQSLLNSFLDSYDADTLNLHNDLVGLKY